MHCLRPFVFALAALHAASIFAAAQQRPSAELESAPIAGWTFRPGIAIAMLFDSNVAIQSAPASTGTTPSDTLFTIDPVGTLKYLGKRTSFETSYRGTIRRYSELSALNGFDQHWGAGLQRRATKRLTLFAQNSYAAVASTDELELNGVPFSRAGSRNDQLGTGLTFRLDERDSLNARYDFTWVAFDRAAPLLTGGVIHGVQSELSHAFTDRFSAGVEGSVRLAHMDVVGGRELRFIDVGGTVGYRLDEFTKVSAAAGLGHLNDLLRDTTRTGPYVRGSITRVALSTLLGASYERSFVPSFGFGGTTRSQEVRGWADFPPIGRRLFLQSAGTWRRTVPFETQDLQLDTIQLRASAGYAVSRWMRAQGFYIFARQDSIVTGGEINRYRIGAEVVLSQPMRIR